MEGKPKSFEFHEQTFKAQCKWEIKLSQRPFKQMVAFPKTSSSNSFVLSKFEAIEVCEDFKLSGLVSDVKFDKMEVLSIDYSPSNEPLIVCSFLNGYLLTMDPIKRKRGKVKWINTVKRCYSSRPPLFCRWIDENIFLVLFGDNFMFKFDNNLQKENETFIKSARNYLKDSLFPVWGSVNNDQVSNPKEIIRFNLGPIHELQVSPVVSQELIVVVCKNVLKVLNYTKYALVAVLYSNFAGFQCAAWSPDGQLVVAGGEDDCIHAWSTKTWRYLFKGVGHTSWVSSIHCKFEDTHYIFTSVGQDGKLLIWEQNYFSLIDNDEIQDSQVCIESHYPTPDQHSTIEATVDALLSSEPLSQVAVIGNCYFVFDMLGNLKMWSNTSL